MFQMRTGRPNKQNVTATTDQHTSCFLAFNVSFFGAQRVFMGICMCRGGFTVKLMFQGPSLARATYKALGRALNKYALSCLIFYS